MRVLGGLGRLTIATLLAGVLVAGLLLPYSLGLGLASNKITNALASTPANSLNAPVPERSTITDNAGSPIAYIYRQDRVVVPLSSISQNLQVAITTVEDKRFRDHHGVDWRGTVRALLSNAQASGGQQGGSTLTQQYVKNYLFLVQAKTDAQRADAIATTPGRKLREAKLALTLEQHETKDDILDGYLNLVAFLPNTYGAEATAERLFGVHAADLSLSQAAMMAGMVNNPNKYNPLDPDHVQDALDRRNLVLKLLYQNGSITQTQLTNASKEGIGTANQKPSATGCLPAQNSAIYGYFCQYVLDYLSNAGLSVSTIADGGYTITTTLDRTTMINAHNAVVANVNPTANPRVANVMAVVAPGTPRKVLALTANRPYGLDATKGQTVQKLPTTFAPLGAGSTFKIFTAAAAMEAGLGTQAIIQTPATYQSPLTPNVFHNDTDGGETFPTSMTLQQALATSPNTGFVKLEDDLGLAKVVDTAVALGLKGYTLNAGDVDPVFTDNTNSYQQEVVSQKIASFTLGVSPVSPLELANVGATLSSSGLWCPPTPINGVLDRNGNPVTLKAAAPCAPFTGDITSSKKIADTLSNAMADDIDSPIGSSHQSAVAANWHLDDLTTPARSSAGKTGTTGRYESSAYLGFTPNYSSSVMTWDYLPKPKPICMVPPNAPSTATSKPLQIVGTCTIAEATSTEGIKNPTVKKTGMTGGSVPAATWFTAMNKIQPNPTLFPPADQQTQTGAPDTIVPALAGTSIDVAKATAAASGYKLQVQYEASSLLANTVTRQIPQASQSALPGTTIQIWVATGATTTGG